LLPRFFRTESFWLPAIFGIAFALIIALLGMVALSYTEKAFHKHARTAEDPLFRGRQEWTRRP
jgi:hypothetical protein